MHSDSTPSTSTPSQSAGMESRSLKDAPQAAPVSSGGMHGEGQTIPTLRNRVQRVQHDLEAGRAVSDDELRQHARDCTFLMECAYDRFMAEDDDAHRQESYAWMRQRDEALRCLSPEWKAAREAQILNAAASGTGCYFVDQADRGREAINERERD